MAARVPSADGHRQSSSKPSRDIVETPPHPERTVVTIALEETLRDIAVPSACPNCGATRQKELVLWETWTDKLTIDAGAVPGYGCTECGAKFLPPSIAARLYRAAAEETRAAGDTIGTQRFEIQERDVLVGLHATAG